MNLKASRKGFHDPAQYRAVVDALHRHGIALNGTFLFGLDEYLSYQALVDNRDWLQQQVAEHAAAAFLAYIAVYAVVVAFSIPGGTVMTLAGGFLFGTLLGGSLTVIWASSGTRAPALGAAKPSTATRPAMIRAWAWARLLARPRATRSWSSRVFIWALP